jgi:hypothetical protein
MTKLCPLTLNCFGLLAPQRTEQNMMMMREQQISDKKNKKQ